MVSGTVLAIREDNSAAAREKNPCLTQLLFRWGRRLRLCGAHFDHLHAKGHGGFHGEARPQNGVRLGAEGQKERQTQESLCRAFHNC